MARAMGPVRMKKTNPVTIAIGVLLCLFIVYFLVGPTNSTASILKKVKSQTASHPLSPATSPYRAASANSKKTPPPVTRYNMNNVTTTADPIGNREDILILTPMARFYQGYWDNLLALDYPHELINLAFILPKNKEGNAATSALQAQVAKTQRSSQMFKSITILRQDFDPPLSSQDEAERHKMEVQKERRAAMAKARNSLLFTTLGPSISWVLWLDSDIIETPHTLIQDLAKHNQAVLAPNCFQRYVDEKTGKAMERPYDFNNWQDSTTAQQLAEKMGPDDILLEGYQQIATYRALMAYMTTEDNNLDYEIPLDGVGGTALFVKADVHRDGAMFPPFSFYHLIETEGFAKMAKRLGWQPVGLPNYKVYHYNE